MKNEDYLKDFHIGRLVKSRLNEEGWKVKWLAEKIDCERDNIYKIFERASIDTGLLLRISIALTTDFFAYLSDYYKSIKNATDGMDRYSVKTPQGKLHIGQLIKSKLEEDGRIIRKLTKKIGCKRHNIYNIFDRQHIDAEQLFKISIALKTNFFDYLSEYYRNIKL
jgi:plasmid maintenance system antidote protein VapI